MIPRCLPPLTALHAFQVAARTQTLAQAAEILCVTHGAVSRQILRLEQELGLALFTPEGRGRRLTPAGRALADRLGPAFSEISDAVIQARQTGQDAPPLVVSCEPTISLKMLIRGLGALHAQTGLAVTVLSAGGAIDLAMSHADLAIRRTDFPLAPHVHRHDLAAEAMGPVLAPALAAHADFSALAPLIARSRPDAWSDWRGPKPQKPAIMFDHHYEVLEAAQAGQGVAMMSVHMVADDLAHGFLAAPHGFQADGTGYVCLSATPFADDARAKAFVGWLGAYMGQRAEPFL